MNQGQTLATYIRSCQDFVIITSIDGNYEHMGATLTDAVLQAGINYKTVVNPRVERIMREYPDARTTTSFARLLEERGVGVVLDWKSGRKLEALRDLTSVLLANGIETEDQLRNWLKSSANAQSLRRIKGIKDKTTDYLQILVGTPTVAVDRHLFRFLALAGLPTGDYNAAHQIIRDAAALLGVDSSILDHSIWRYMSDRPDRAVAVGSIG